MNLIRTPLWFVQLSDFTRSIESTPIRLFQMVAVVFFFSVQCYELCRLNITDKENSRISSFGTGSPHIRLEYE